MAISRITVSVLVLAVAAIWTPPASGQTASNGAIRGYVRDATGAVVPGTTVTATAPDATTPFSALTDADGNHAEILAFDVGRRYASDRAGLHRPLQFTGGIGQRAGGEPGEGARVRGAEPAHDR